jgi:hypothetical protein
LYQKVVIKREILWFFSLLTQLIDFECIFNTILVHFSFILVRNALSNAFESTLEQKQEKQDWLRPV